MEGQIGKVAKYDAEFKDGQFSLSVTESDAYGSTTIVRTVDAKVVLDAIAKLGTLEADIVAVIEKAVLPAPAAAAPSA